MSWAIDLGNSHTRIARWNAERELPRLVELPAVCRLPGGQEPMAAPRLVPTATEVLESQDWRTLVGRWPLVRDFAFLGRRAYIGRIFRHQGNNRVGGRSPCSDPGGRLRLCG